MSDTKALDLVLKTALRMALSDSFELTTYAVREAAAELEQIISGLAQAELTCQSYYECQINDREIISRLRAELDEARKVIIELTHPLDYDQQFSHAHAWLSAHPEEKT